MERYKEPNLQQVEAIALNMQEVNCMEMIHPVTHAYVGRQILSALGYFTNDISLDPKCACGESGYVYLDFFKRVFCKQCAQSLDA